MQILFGCMSNHNELPHERAQFTSFQESTKEDWSLIMRQIGNTQNMVADNALHLLRQLGNDHGGFPVSRLEHSLQTATRAAKLSRSLPCLPLPVAEICIGRAALSKQSV